MSKFLYLTIHLAWLWTQKDMDEIDYTLLNRQRNNSNLFYPMVEFFSDRKTQKYINDINKAYLYR